MSEKFYHSKESVQQYVEMAKNVSGISLIDALNQYVQANSEILEIGSGPGTDWKLLSEKHTVIGSDNSTFFLDHLRQTYPEGEFILLDAAKLETDRSFDAIYSNKVLHHLTNEELKQSVQGQLALLRPNGLICHSFWKGEGEEDFKGMFVNYHSQDEITDLFSPYFDLLLLNHYQEFEADDSILMIGRKK